MAEAGLARSLVSVIIPAYNAESHIRDSIASALAQSYRDIEVVVVDDGSQDRTVAIVEQITAEDTRVRLLRQPNRGVAAARNHGIENARGALIAPLDADDLWHPDKIVKQIAVMRKGGPRLGLVYAWSSIIDETGHLRGRFGSVADHYGEVYPALVLRNFIGNASAPLIRRRCLMEIGGYDASLRARGGQGCEDLMLYLALAERYDMALVPEFLVGYRVTAQSMSHDVLQMKRSHDLVRTAARRRHPELPNRLFRWSEAILCFWLAHQSRRAGRLWQALSLVRLTLQRDPAFVFQPVFRQAVSQVIPTVLRTLRRVRGLNPRAAMPLFLDLPSQPEGPISEHVGPLGRRRMAFVRSLHIHRAS